MTSSLGVEVYRGSVGTLPLHCRAANTDVLDAGLGGRADGQQCAATVRNAGVDEVGGLRPRDREPRLDPCCGLPAPGDRRLRGRVRRAHAPHRSTLARRNSYRAESEVPGTCRPWAPGRGTGTAWWARTDAEAGLVRRNGRDVLLGLSDLCRTSLVGMLWGAVTVGADERHHPAGASSRCRARALPDATAARRRAARSTTAAHVAALRRPPPARPAAPGAPRRRCTRSWRSLLTGSGRAHARPVHEPAGHRDHGRRRLGDRRSLTRCCSQGDLPKGRLLGGVRRGTRPRACSPPLGFWQGVDVPGRALSAW